MTPHYDRYFAMTEDPAIHLDNGRKYSFHVPESEIHDATSVLADLLPAASMDFNDRRDAK